MPIEATAGSNLLQITSSPSTICSIAVSHAIKTITSHLQRSRLLAARDQKSSTLR